MNWLSVRGLWKIVDFRSGTVEFVRMGLEARSLQNAPNGNEIKGK
jgi:hypothetical protein